MLNGTIEVLKDGLSKPRKIVITTHQKPDGDAMGSSLGLYNYLVEKKHQVTVVTPTDYPSFLNWLPGNDLVISAEQKKVAAEKAIAEADIIFCLDFNALSRIVPIDSYVADSLAYRVLIDHHMEPDDFPDLMFWNTKASSTCELIFDFVHLLEDNPLISIDTATCLYTGLLTDTGNFSNGATTPKAMRLGADLIEKGASFIDIQEKLHNNNLENKLRFLGNSLLNKMVIIPEIEFGYIYVNKEDSRKFNLQSGDTEGLVNFPLSVKGVRIAALIKEDMSMIKLSFRSKGEINVNEFARQHFNGGGHKNAAGGRSNENLDKTIHRIIDLLKLEKAKKKY